MGGLKTAAVHPWIVVLFVYLSFLRQRERLSCSRTVQTAFIFSFFNIEKLCLNSIFTYLDWKRKRFRPRPSRSCHTAHQLVGVVVYLFFAHIVSVPKTFLPFLSRDMQAKYKEAETLYIRSLTIDEKVHGPDHPIVATGLNSWAGVLCRQVRAIVLFVFRAMFLFPLVSELLRHGKPLYEQSRATCIGEGLTFGEP